MATNVFQQYKKQFGIDWPKLIPQDVEFVKHCLELGTSADDLPDSDPFIKKYYSNDILY